MRLSATIGELFKKKLRHFEGIIDEALSKYR